MNIPLDVALGLALIALASGGLIGGAIRKPPRRYISARYEPDYSDLPVLEGESAKYFQHDYDGPEVVVARRVM